MKKTIFVITIFLLALTCATAATSKTKKKKKTAPISDEKIYTVPETKAEIKLDVTAPPLKSVEKQRVVDAFHAGLILSSLHYELPSFINSSQKFSQDMVGVLLGKRKNNSFALFQGNYEMNISWERFKRESGMFSQHLNLYRLEFIQSIDLAWSFKRSLFFTAGLGFSPIYLTADQSVFGNSVDKVGGLGLLTFDFIFPILKKYELDLNLKNGWGSVGGKSLSVSQLNLGINFE